MKMNKQNIFLAAFMGIIGISVVFALASVLSLYQPVQQEQQSMPRLARMSLSSFDKQLAREMMDKNGDGMCDVCGMPVEMCMDSGQLQCNMDSKATIGILESQHIHADIKIYLSGDAVDLSGKSHMERMRSGQSVSSFIHVDSGAPSPERTGDVLHMHATGVPLWIFFNSIEIELPDSARMYVNGKEIRDYINYVFSDLNKILITDGAGSLNEQLSSITDFAKNH
ncbi:MAG: hypothetical protein HY517_03655 [Candidatus Aenigmarchaeota archaeon]|nr:hypothetical protein [Candidatus Aenigmarchaeota archaeon]